VLLARLSGLGLLREDAVPEPRALFDSPTPQSMLRLCHAGALEGGLSVALDVRPDELVGPLSARVGGGARRLKVLDVREGPARLVLEVEREGRSEAWEVRGTVELVDRMNAAFAGDRLARGVALLGEYDEMWQLWCVPKSALPLLWSEPWFSPLNRAALSSGGGGS
jgi:hypothetical protein